MSKTAALKNARISLGHHDQIVRLFTEWLKAYREVLNELSQATILVDNKIATNELMSELDCLLECHRVDVDLASMEASDLFSFEGKVVLCIGKRRSMFSRYGIIKVFDEDLGDLPQVWEI